MEREVVELPEGLLEEAKLLASAPDPRESAYAVYAPRLSDRPELRYVRLQQSYGSTTYDVGEVAKLARAGAFLVAVVVCRPGPALPTARDVLTWWLTDARLNASLTYVIASVEGGRVRLRYYDFSRCKSCPELCRAVREVEWGADGEGDS